METPSSVRMAIASQKSKMEASMTKSRPNDRSALLDITNDSPIVGLATGSLSEKTPPSSAIKNRDRAVKSTPGSGEALLRGQVKTLLQKVEEEAELVHNNGRVPSGDHHRPQFRVLLDLPGPSPAQILAPTPANTPQVPCLSELIEVAEAVKPVEEPQECLINRALLFDSPGKSEVTDSSSSAISYQDDSSSAWSMQVNVDVQDEEEEEEEEEEIEDFDEEEDYEDAEDGYCEESSFDDLCEGLSKMTVGGEFAGKHTRFVYNSDDEIEGEEVIGDDDKGEKKNVSPSVLMLRGLPVPEGKHLRFHDEEDEE